MLQNALKHLSHLDKKKRKSSLLQFDVDAIEICISINRISGISPKVAFIVPIDATFKVECYNHSKLISSRHLIGFAVKLERYS